MQIIVLADELSREEFQAKNIDPEIDLIFTDDYSCFQKHNTADAFFILKEEINNTELEHFSNKPVILNLTVQTLKELALPNNFIRINGWHTFLKREVLEVAGANEHIIKDICDKLNWKYIKVADEPGLVSARVISMIINEAYYALGEDVSTKEEIDLAMKLGTNYPYGPFEWCNKIGLKNVHSLLTKLSKTDSRYSIAPAMEKEFLNN